VSTAAFSCAMATPTAPQRATIRSKDFMRIVLNIVPYLISRPKASNDFFTNRLQRYNIFLKYARKIKKNLLSEQKKCKILANLQFYV
jgi:hypothetical protein